MATATAVKTRKTVKAPRMAPERPKAPTAQSSTPGPTKAPHAEPGPQTTRLTVRIGGTSYAVRRIAVEDRGFGVLKCYRLRKLTDGDLYDVAQLIEGHSCTCADYEFRHAGNGSICKHAKALIAWGLLD
jgi:hypothetical protein